MSVCPCSGVHSCVNYLSPDQVFFSPGRFLHYLKKQKQIFVQNHSECWRGQNWKLRCEIFITLWFWIQFVILLGYVPPPPFCADRTLRARSLLMVFRRQSKAFCKCLILIHSQVFYLLLLFTQAKTSIVINSLLLSSGSIFILFIFTDLKELC